MCNELHIQIYACVNFQFQIDTILYYTYFCCDLTTTHLENRERSNIFLATDFSYYQSISLIYFYLPGPVDT